MRFEYWKSRKEWFFHVVARNGRIVAQSEGYTRRAFVLKTIASLQRGAAKAVVVEVKK